MSLLATLDLPSRAIPSLSSAASHGATLFQVTTQSTAAPTTTFPLVPSDPAESAIGGIVFFIVVLIIAAGALVLYLRNRAPRAKPDAGVPPRSS